MIERIDAYQTWNTDDGTDISFYVLKIFLGTWHELERTTFQWGENTWHSQVWVFKRGANGHLYMAYTGYSAQSKSCSSPQTGLLTHSGSGASYTLTSEGRYEAALRVAYTDYSNVALVYMCYAPEVLGTCDRNRVHVSLLSRSPSMSKAQRTILMTHIDLECVENGHLHQATSGLCQEPIPSKTVDVWICCTAYQIRRLEQKEHVDFKVTLLFMNPPGVVLKVVVYSYSYDK
uniref:Uncharacterized protein n=1 Tax=Magallana gigas TaxID=29159 RepID=K1PQ06_MAGGI